MPQESSKGSHRNGGRAHVLPTSERVDNISKPHNFRSSVTNTPEPILYGVTLLLVIFGVTFLIVGSVYTVQCELQPMLPVWLLVMGIILGCGGVWHGIFVHSIKKEPFKSVKPVEKVIGFIILFAYIGWFIAGNVWVYMAWGEKPDYGHYWFENGCNKSVFILSFCAIITMDSFVGLLLIGCCFWGVSKVVVKE